MKTIEIPEKPYDHNLDNIFDFRLRFRVSNTYYTLLIQLFAFLN